MLNIRKGKDLTTEIQKILREGMSTLDISKELCRDNRTKKKAVKNIS